MSQIKSGIPRWGYLVRRGFTMTNLRPAFFIIGERKCATSSLYRYLLEHPQVLPCRLKEPQFFSKSLLHRLMFRQHYFALYPDQEAQEATIDWYVPEEQHGFSVQQLRFTRDPNLPCITGEASANTFAQVPPKRLHTALPGVRLILCLRHPVDRAYAHYRMLERFAREGRRIAFRFTDFKTDFIEDFGRKHGGYFAQVSLYAKRLKAWAAVFGMERIELIRTEDLSDPAKAQDILDHLCASLEIGRFDFSEILQSKENVSGQAFSDSALRDELMHYYAQDILALESFTGRKFHWRS